MLLERSTGSRAIYLNFRAEPALATLLAGANSLVDLRGHGPERLKRLSARLGVGIAPLYTLSPGELAAMSWLAESLTRLEALDRFADRVIPVDFDDFLGNVAGSMQRILAHFDLPADAAQLARLAASPVHERDRRLPNTTTDRPSGRDPGPCAACPSRRARQGHALAGTAGKIRA